METMEIMLMEFYASVEEDWEWLTDQPDNEDENEIEEVEAI
jgi:hypothetical protein